MLVRGELQPSMSSAFQIEPAVAHPLNLRESLKWFRSRMPACHQLSIGALEKDPELSRSRVMPQLSQCLGFDLANSFSRNGKRLADLLQRQFVAVLQAKAHLDDSFFARGQRLQHGSQVLLQIEMNGRIRWRDHALILDEITKMGFLVLPDGRFERHRLLRDLLRFADRVEGKIHTSCELLGSWFTSEFLHQLPAGASLLVDRLNHVYGNADGAGLIGDGASDPLANPPGRIGGELVSAAPFEFVGALHETDIALLDQIEELHATIRIFFGD